MKSFSQIEQLRDEYYRDHCFSVDMVEIHIRDFRDGTPLPIYLNSGGVDISYDSPTAITPGANLYEAQGNFIGFSALTEDFDVKVGKFTIYLSALNNDYLEKFLGNNIQGSRVVVYKAFLDLTTLGIVIAPILMFDGIIFNIACTESSRSAQITLECSSLFADFERTAGRKTNNWSNWVFQGVNYDTSMEKAGFVGQTEFKWGRA